MTVTDAKAAAKTVSVVAPTAHLSEEYARAENEKLWGKVWQVACRVEEIPNVGDYVTYDILDESIIVARVAKDEIAAYYNVCQHRGRRLTEGCGHASRFVCRFHGWSWSLKGENVNVHWREDFGDGLRDDHLRLKPVKIDTWGGYVFVNMDPQSEPLAAFLGDVPRILDPYEIDKMRFRWRRWVHFPCNWKTALEAFMEGYHVLGTHPQLTRIGGAKKSWSRAHGKHSGFGVQASGGSFGGASAGAQGATDMRIGLAESVNELWETLNASTTQTIVNAANRLVDELPEGTPADKAAMHLMMSAVKEDAARGVIWPKLTPAQLQEAGIGWNIFPNTMILQGPTFVLGYRARPNGYNPSSCIFEVYALDRFPEGEAPKTENLHTEADDPAWGKILDQDFSNMQAVQQGMKSRGYTGAKLNPVQEVVVENFHRTLADYMGVNAPKPLK